MDFIRLHQQNAMLFLSGTCFVLSLLSFFSKTLGTKRRLTLMGMEFVAGMLLIMDRFAYIVSNCSDTEYKSIILYDYRLEGNDTSISLGFKLQDKLYQRKISSNTKSLRIIKGSEIFSVEHESSFCTKIISSNSSIYVYIFPNGTVTSDYDSYIVSNAKGVYAFFIECSDSAARKNYYIFSKDTVIKKETEINYSENYLDKLQELGDNDIGFYNDDMQPLGYPYAGYVIQDSNGNFLLLSTLWENS
ncbi:MAG: hypothetical protein IJ828_06435, partial [Treponema sp.]|nr:hypothetical protein [Treponema sp.]